MLHTLWGKAQEHPDYDKEQWKKLQAQFDGLLAACKLCLPRMRQALSIRQNLTGIASGGISDTVQKLEAAIAKAEEE